MSTATVKTSPLISVVVPTYRRPYMLHRCLRALARQDLPKESFEIIVADDGADRETEQLVAHVSEEWKIPIRYVPVIGAHGPAAARNTGWRAARAPVIAFTDDDCMPMPSWLSRGLAGFQSGIVAVRGTMVMPLPAVPTDYELNASNLETAEFVTANCFCLRRTLKEIGGFDERFRRAWREDSDLFFRLLAEGPVIKQQDAIVVHPIRPAPWGVSVRQQRNNVDEALIYKKHRSLARERLHVRPPWRYYGIVACALGSVIAAATGRRTALKALGTAWLSGTFLFLRSRLRGTSHSPAHIAEMIATSVVIPPVAIYWRLRGALRYRVPFM